MDRILLNKLYKIFTFILIVIFSVSVFKNLHTPLLWGDEAETAEYGRRILRYGYPKVHDGVNSLNLTLADDKSIGVKESIDAWIHLPWLQYYIASIGVYASSFNEDMYYKTLAVRLPFAVLGFLAVMLFMVTSSKFVRDEDRPLYKIFFLFFIILSVPLVLQIREVRGHVLTIFTFSLVFWVFAKYYFLKKMSTVYFIVLANFALLLILNNFMVVDIAFILTVIVFLVLDKLVFKIDNKKLISDIFKSFLIFGVLSLPIIFYFEMLKVNTSTAGIFQFGYVQYLDNLLRIIIFFTIYDHLIPSVFMSLLLFYIVSMNKKLLQNDYLNLYIRVISFLWIYFIFYILIISRIPNLFDKYYVGLNLVITAILSLGIVVLASLTKTNNNIVSSKFIRNIYTMLGILFLLGIVFRVDILKGYIGELKTGYKGPMDFLITYINDNFNDPSNLVVYTNIEQVPIIFYLGSRVRCDFDVYCWDGTPDIIVPRRFETSNKGYYNAKVEEFLESGNYQKIIFGVLDYPVNNIAELSLPLKHLFQTPYTDNKESQLYLYKKILN